MNITEIKPILSAAHSANDAVLITGLHGIGKSEIIKQYADENDYFNKQLFLSMFEVGDLLGIPYIEDGKTTWAEPDWFRELNNAAWPEHFKLTDLVFNDKEFEAYVKDMLTSLTTKKELTDLYNSYYGTFNKNVLTTNQNNVECNLSKKTILFTDEFSRAQQDVHNACLQLILDKKLHNHVLPYTKGVQTQIIAADNPDNGDYNVNSLDGANIDRFMVLDVELDVKAWLDYARRNDLNKIVTSFIADNPSKLHWTPAQGSDERVGATPRSWTVLSKYLDNSKNIPEHLMYQVFKGKIGSALAGQFLSFYKNFSDMISVEDVEKLAETLIKKTKDPEKLGEGIQELIKDLEAIQVTELVKGMQPLYIDKSPEEALPFMSLLYALPIELLAAYLKTFSKEDPKKYAKLANIDHKINNGKKKLFIRVVSRATK